MKVALDTERTQALLSAVAGLFAPAKLPPAVAKLLCTGTLTALLKPSSKVRGRVAGGNGDSLLAIPVRSERSRWYQMCVAYGAHGFASRP